ncbi:zinc-binding dehydrogenase [Paenibacillus elgii]|uniref:zinc-binding dehydrogenase n=1 Tax=Paenibacillus elgii TaxID=189691 RepID=UPI000248C1D2|nr:zinc-binding dehydrogenase [Paenibacillus elgii]
MHHTEKFDGTWRIPSDGKNMNRIRELVEEGKLKPLVSEVYPMSVDGVRKAHLASQTGRMRGKIVLSREFSQ